MSIINDKLLRNDYTSTQSQNILTFMQVVASENPDVCLTIFHNIMKEINTFKHENLPLKYQHLKMHFQLINDGKMIYALSQHSLFSRKFHPFQACKCCRGIS